MGFAEYCIHYAELFSFLDLLSKEMGSWGTYENEWGEEAGAKPFVGKGIWEQFLSQVDEGVVLAQPGPPFRVPAIRPQVKLREGWLCPFKPPLIALDSNEGLMRQLEGEGKGERRRHRLQWGRPAPDVTRVLAERSWWHQVDTTAHLHWPHRRISARSGWILPKSTDGEELQGEGIIWGTT